MVINDDLVHWRIYASFCAKVLIFCVVNYFEEAQYAVVVIVVADNEMEFWAKAHETSYHYTLTVNITSADGLSTGKTTSYFLQPWLFRGPN